MYKHTVMIYTILPYEDFHTINIGLQSFHAWKFFLSSVSQMTKMFFPYTLEIWGGGGWLVEAFITVDVQIKLLWFIHVYDLILCSYLALVYFDTLCITVLYSRFIGA